MNNSQVFKFIRDGVSEEVPLERWVWLAIYKDGSYLKQFDEETGLFHQFKEIDIPQLDVFGMQSSEDENKRYEIHMKEGMTPIHFYRNQMLNVGTEEEVKVRFYCFGYQDNVNGNNVKTLLKILPNDMVAILNTDDRIV